jgi:hypothetical protein
MHAGWRKIAFRQDSDGGGLFSLFRKKMDLSLEAQLELFLIDANSLLCPLNDVTEV